MAVVVIAEPCTLHQLLLVALTKPGIQGFQPAGGGIFRQPGDIHQQRVERRITEQKTADRQV